MSSDFTFRNHRTQERSCLSIPEIAKAHRLTAEQDKKLIGGKSVHCWVWNKALTVEGEARQAQFEATTLTK